MYICTRCFILNHNKNKSGEYKLSFKPFVHLGAHGSQTIMGTKIGSFCISCWSLDKLPTPCVREQLKVRVSKSRKCSFFFLSISEVWTQTWTDFERSINGESINTEWFWMKAAGPPLSSFLLLSCFPVGFWVAVMMIFDDDSCTSLSD